ncbi:hypothetical protein QW131_10655 [Roseibium salinum]|nr:hypothetical protein [Roseibium salinum]
MPGPQTPWPHRQPVTLGPSANETNMRAHAYLTTCCNARPQASQTLAIVGPTSGLAPTIPSFQPLCGKVFSLHKVPGNMPHPRWKSTSRLESFFDQRKLQKNKRFEDAAPIRIHMPDRVRQWEAYRVKHAAQSAGKLTFCFNCSR